MNENTKKRPKWVKPALISLIVVLALILTVVVAMLIGWKYFVNRLGSAAPNETVSIIPPEQEDFETDPPITTQEPTNVPTEGTESTEATEPTEPETQPPMTEPPTPTRPNIAWPEVEKLQSNDVINILLVGKDASSSDGRPRTDSMILISINKKTDSLTMVSIMRDLYVQIPGGYSDNRINAAYRFGGINLLNATVEQNFGVVIDGNFEVDFRQFEKIIDILGGVEIELTQAEASYLQRNGYPGVVPGKNLLGGPAALTYCRIRQIDSDHQRTERQRKLLMTVAAKAQGMSATQVLEVINTVLPYVQTNLSESELFRVLNAGIQALLSGNGIKQGKVPQSGHYYGANIMGMQVLVPNLYQCNQYLKAFIYG